ncbi:Lrp/AsnC family transcriptional regulator [Marinomonas sp. C2222]|uniref:Lrp/AsnC family transcriptional regulator n=1 Tax=Marinomonas sargassi TaxID=2984494 RepID=A0ABT2YRL8_9GAMM|nr:Lrp/AsnC family transcriptional regulator [Marinomonas sargassi]MCV2402511.1 Lrp/AsnC family transcriptional regulator [Marinomonas sargassi]
MNNELDKIDLAILGCLQVDASLSTLEIAEKVNLSQTPCWRRIQRLEEKGFIQQKVAVLNRKSLGFNLVLYTEVKLSENDENTLALFEQAICQHAEITECYSMLGNSDFLLRIVTKDMESYERFFYKHLSKLPKIHAINSNAVLSELKNTQALPLQIIG